MDHLPYPKNPAFARPLVLYVCTESYDGQGFLTYPNRAGWPKVLPSAEYPNFMKHERAHPSNDEELEKFFQTWIFFGLLHEALSPQGLYHEEEYIRTVQGVKHVHTTNLIGRLKSWRTLASDWQPSKRLSVYSHLVECLKLATTSLMVLSQFERTDVLADDIRHPYFNRGIKTSLAAVCETIANAADDALVPIGVTKMPNSWPTIWWDVAVERKLRHAGWCPSEIARLSQDFRFFSAQHYLYALKISPSFGEEKLHRACTGNMCEESLVKKGTYRSVHCCEDDSCRFLGPDIQDIYQELSAESVPLLRIWGASTDDVQIEVVSYEAGMRYVALSHVWKDGLGNETSNQLPRCQLLRLLSFVDQLRKQLHWGCDAVDPGELYLWIDTLCCPVANSTNPATLQEQQRQKRRAIASMNEVYERASYVLVLDRSLEPYSYKDVGVVEAAIRLLQSPWMRRLWTLQEAVLAKNLLIQFQDQAVDLRTIWQDARSLGRSDLSHRVIGLAIEFACAEIRTFYPRVEGNPSGADLAKVNRSIKLRRMNKQVSEPLCIASLMKLDVSKISGLPGDGEARMCSLWKAIADANHKINKDIIFNTFRRLRTDGFRWAPASLQQSNGSHGEILPELPESSTQLATLTERGLLVKLPAFRIRIEMEHPDLPSNLWSGEDLVNDCVHLRHPDGRWYWVSRTYTSSRPHVTGVDETPPGRDLTNPGRSLWSILTEQSKTRYLIMEDPRFSSSLHQSGVQKGIIAYPEGCERGAVVMRTLILVTVTIAKSDERLLWERSLELANDIRRMEFPAPNVEQNAYKMVAQGTKVALMEKEFAAVVQGAVAPNPKAVQAFTDMSGTAGPTNSVARLPLEDTAKSQEIFNSEILLGGLIAARVQGRYAILEESFEPDTMWCID